MTQPDELKDYKFDTDAYTIVDFAKLKPSPQQAIADVKRLRAACTKPLISDEDISIDTDWGDLEEQRWALINKALAATDRPEYKEVE